MTVTLNHAIVPALDNRQAARFFASVMGLQELPPAGRTGNFAPVRVNEQLTLDFMTVDEPAGLHLAFDVDPATFDRILTRLRAAGIPNSMVTATSVMCVSCCDSLHVHTARHMANAHRRVSLPRSVSSRT